MVAVARAVLALPIDAFDSAGRVRNEVRAQARSVIRPIGPKSPDTSGAFYLFAIRNDLHVAESLRPSAASVAAGRCIIAAREQARGGVQSNGGWRHLRPLLEAASTSRDDRNPSRSAPGWGFSLRRSRRLARGLGPAPTAASVSKKNPSPGLTCWGFCRRVKWRRPQERPEVAPTTV